MAMEGVQQGTIVEHSVYTKDNGTVDVNIKMALVDNSTINVHVNITEKSKRMARAALKKCGFNPDTQDVWDLDEKPTLLNGNEVQIDVFMDEYPPGSGKRKLKAEIVLERQKPDANTMKKATTLLRDAKSKDDEPNEGAQKIIEGFPQTRRTPQDASPEPEAPF
jgi:hypothetical protein